MDQVLAAIQAHPVYWSGFLLFAHHAFDAAVDSLPEPQSMGSPVYKFAFTFLNKIAGNYRQK